MMMLGLEIYFTQNLEACATKLLPSNLHIFEGIQQ